MSREQDRIKRKLESNAIIECNRIQRKVYPELFQKFSQTEDPRKQGYVLYSNKIMLGTLYYKGIAGITSMQDMTDKFNDFKVVENLTAFMGESGFTYLPHYVTENEYLKHLDPQELQDIQQDIVYQIIRRKSFVDSRFMKKWLIIVDGTETYSGSQKHNNQCLERHHNKGTEHESVNYYESVLEAKIYFGEGIVASIASEFIENNSEDAERQKGMNADEIKQDCETKAFKRLAAKLKRRFPKLPIIMLLDSLYASEPVMTLCRENGWDYIIRFKDGSIPSIAGEYKAIPEKESVGHAEYINDIMYNEIQVNMLKYCEEKIEKGKIVRTTFQWITNITITLKNAEKLASAGRKRWKIENEGFNRQKNWQEDITHACSWNRNAQKNHYLMLQISDFMKQLYEYYFLKRNEIKKKQKNISPDLLASFGRQLTREDIFSTTELMNNPIT